MSMKTPFSCATIYPVLFTNHSGCFKSGISGIVLLFEQDALFRPESIRPYTDEEIAEIDPAVGIVRLQ